MLSFWIKKMNEVIFSFPAAPTSQVALLEVSMSHHLRLGDVCYLYPAFAGDSQVKLICTWSGVRKAQHCYFPVSHL